MSTQDEVAAYALDLDRKHLLSFASFSLQYLLGNTYTCACSTRLLDAQSRRCIPLKLLLRKRASGQVSSHSSLELHHRQSKDLHLAPPLLPLNATQFLLLLQYLLQLGVFDAHPRVTGNEFLCKACRSSVFGTAERCVLEVHVAPIVIA